MLLKKLPKASEQSGADYGRATKGAAAHFLAKLYLQRAQGLIMEQQNTDVRRMEVLIILMRSHIWVCYTKEKALLT